MSETHYKLFTSHRRYLRRGDGNFRTKPSQQAERLRTNPVGMLCIRCPATPNCRARQSMLEVVGEQHLWVVDNQGIRWRFVGIEQSLIHVQSAVRYWAGTSTELHDVLQVAFGWQNSHLYDFDVNGIRFGVVDVADVEDVADEVFAIDERAALLGALVTPGSKLLQ